MLYFNGLAIFNRQIIGHFEDIQERAYQTIDQYMYKDQSNIIIAHLIVEYEDE